MPVRRDHSKFKKVFYKQLRRMELIRLSFQGKRSYGSDSANKLITILGFTHGLATHVIYLKQKKILA